MSSFVHYRRYSLVTLAIVAVLSEGAWCVERTITYESVEIRKRLGITLGASGGRETIISKHWRKGNKTRADRREGVKEPWARWIDITVPGATYQLDVRKKTGVKRPSTGVAHFDPLQRLAAFKERYPSSEDGEEIINGEKCIRYQATYLRSSGDDTTIRVWARQSDSAVVKSESVTKTWRYITEFRNIESGVEIDDALFEIPKGYTIEEKK